MNYNKLYFKIISHAANTLSDYTENHHILPKSLGGTDEITNLVRLTAREHFLCHYLLAKMYPMFSESWFKMNNAFIMMRTNPYGNRYVNSRLYESLRKNFSIVMSANQTGSKNSNFGTIWVYNELLCVNKKIKKTDSIPDGWLPGRKFIWGPQFTICDNCNINFLKTQSRFCSEECSKSTIKNRVDEVDDTILRVSKDYEIFYKSVSKNSKFIKALLNLKIPQHRIFKFLKCTSSGPNYKTFNRIRDNCIMD
jgi:hypothetical protein